VGSLTKGLFNFYGVDQNRIALNLDGCRLSVSMETAIPCGLIVNELVSNSLKYAFPEKRIGKVSIAIRKEEGPNGWPSYVLNVTDDGIGLPDDFEMRKSNSLGMQIVVSLAEHQLRGSLTIERSSGTAFSIRFPVKAHVGK